MSRTFVEGMVPIEDQEEEEEEVEREDNRRLPATRHPRLLQHIFKGDKTVLL